MKEAKLWRRVYSILDSSHPLLFASRVESSAGCGIPDILLLIPDGITVFIELKTSYDNKTLRLRASQVNWIENAIKCKVPVFVLATFFQGYCERFILYKPDYVYFRRLGKPMGSMMSYRILDLVAHGAKVYDSYMFTDCLVEDLKELCNVTF